MTHGTLQALDESQLARVLHQLGQEAWQHRFEVAPNPCVGAAVISSGKVIARGFHTSWGEAHAEARAIEAAGSTGIASDRWDALVVTLEPCSSQGKTPPCVERIVQSGVRRVVVGAVDPDPRHRGRGIELLREAGLEVVLLEGYVLLDQIAPHFLRWIDTDRRRIPYPWTIAKWAQTLTGQLIPPGDIGEGRWISGAAARQEVQLLRSHVDAIVTGVGTVLADDPRLTLRDAPVGAHPPLRVVLDSWLSTPPDARLFSPGTGEGGDVHILCRIGSNPARHRALVEAGAHVHELRQEREDDRIALRDVQEWLWDRDVRRVLVEAGPGVLTSYLESGFVDQLRIYTGDVKGGRGPSMAEALAKIVLDDRLDRESGDDAVLESFPSPRRL